MHFEMIAFIGQSCVTAVLNLIMFLFFTKFYGAKYKNILVYMCSYTIVCLLMITVNQFNIGMLNFVYAFISFNIVCLKLFNAKVKQILLYNSLLIFAMLASDIMTIFIWTIIQGDVLESVLNNNHLMLISNMLNIFIMLFVYKLYVTIICKKEIKSIQYQESLFLLFMTALEIYIIYIFIQKADNSKDGITILVIILGFLLLNIYATYIIDKVSVAYKLKYEFTMIKHQNELQLANYKEISKKYEKSRVMLHDIKKHLNVLGELQDGDNKKASEYTNMIENQVDALFGGFQCSNQILSIVLSQKIALAESLNIEVNTRVQDITFDFMNDLDITALFTNLWDNAIEACKKIESERRVIHFEIKKVNGFILINVANSFDGIIKRHNRQILSTKDNHTGIGLSIIKDTTDKYNGLYVINTDDNMFINEITIPIAVT